MVSYLDIMADEAKEVKSITSKFKSKEAEDGTTVTVTLKNAMTSVTTNDALLEGIPVQRMTSRSVWKSRVITLSDDKQAFFITHSKVPSGLTSQLASTLALPMFSLRKGLRWSNDSERFIRYLDIADIDGWQVGAIGVQKLENAKKPISESEREKLVTIYHHGFKSMCFSIADEKNRQYLIEAIKGMKARYNLMYPWINNDQLLLRYIYYDIDKDKNGTVSASEFRALCKRINYNAPSDVGKTYAEFAKDKKEISIHQTKDLLYAVAIGDDVMPAEGLWDKLSKEDKPVGPKKFLQKFLHKCQGESDLTEADAERFILSMKSMGNGKKSKKITKTEFVHFLHSKYNAAYDPAATAPLSPTTKLDKPLSNYWINTSHNTYLMGDQLRSNSSVEAYQNALNRGCKCLEFDCWDGHIDKETNECVPVIYHGHTITSKMPFRNACLVTNNYLKANPTSYPIILSLENHCTLDFQKVMAKDMNEIFGKKLFVPTEKQCKGSDLPSPESLRGMVIIKGKRPPEPDEGASVTQNLEDDYDDGFNSSDEDSGDDSASNSPATDTGSKHSRTGSKHSRKKEKPKKKIQSELRKVTLLHGAHFKEFEKSIDQNPTTMHSIGETKITKIVSKAEENADKWREYNHHHMTRTYPAGTRVDSSNYNPVLAWAMGCQLVALNFQTSDSSLLLNDGLFRQAGEIGYLLKPSSLMGGPKPGKKTVKITVLSARCIPKPNGEKTGELVDAYIQVDLHDVRVGEDGTEEHVKESNKTSTVNNNGYNPVWKKGNAFTYEVHNPDVAMIHFRIIDDDLGVDDKIASSAVPFSCLRKGYRNVQLYDMHNSRTGPFESSTLFVKIEH